MKAKIEFTIEAPTDCTEEQFKEWIEYELSYSNEIDVSNPLCDYDFVIRQESPTRPAITILDK